MLRLLFGLFALVAILIGCSGGVPSADSTDGTLGETNGALATEKAPVEPEPMDFATLKAKLTQYCDKCHSGNEHWGGIVYDKIVDEASAKANIKIMRKSFRQMKKGDMPPTYDKNQPTDAERASMIAALEKYSS